MMEITFRKKVILMKPLITNFIKSISVIGNFKVSEAITETHKDCSDCEGRGYDIKSGSFNECKWCNGTGIVRKTFKEQYNLPEDITLVKFREERRIIKSLIAFERYDNKINW
ncbi:hypothetical protein H7F28_23275 [Brevibacterium sp. PAMC23299]|nr:hypothetical protein H7F28_23275 [Brevibacterium sp. PAMC23299]